MTKSSLSVRHFIIRILAVAAVTITGLGTQSVRGQGSRADEDTIRQAIASTTAAMNKHDAGARTESSPRILDMMQRDGIIGPPDGSKPRDVLKRPDWLREVQDQLK